MSRQQLEQSVGNLAREFFRAKLGRVPESLEVRAVERLLIVRIEGFLSPADKMSMERARWPFGKIRCTICGERFSKQEMRLSPGERRVGVCRHCFDGWSTRGRTCGRCGQPVTGNQSVAVFREQRSIGHFDCGGVSIAAH